MQKACFLYPSNTNVLLYICFFLFLILALFLQTDSVQTTNPVLAAWDVFYCPIHKFGHKRLYLSKLKIRSQRDEESLCEKCGAHHCFPFLGLRIVPHYKARSLLSYLKVPQKIQQFLSRFRVKLFFCALKHFEHTCSTDFGNTRAFLTPTLIHSFSHSLSVWRC